MADLADLTDLANQVLGTPVEAIMATEDRDVFNQKLAGELLYKN